MKVLVNAQPLLTKKTGVGNYVLKISEEFLKTCPENEFSFYYGGLSVNSLDFTTGGMGGLKKVEGLRKLIMRIPKVRGLFGRIKKLASRRALQNQDFDIYFETNFVPELSVRAKKTVVMVFDLSFLNREWTPDYRYKFFFENFGKNLAKADLVLTCSETIKKEIIAYYELPEGKVKSVYLGIDGSIFNPVHDSAIKTGMSGKYILFVGSIQPRKNISGLIKAYSKLSQELRAEYKLALVGFDSWNFDRKELPAGADIRLIENVADDRVLAEIYRNASLFVFPSFYEGFGFPPLEAMACGCPVIASNGTPLPEICGDGAVYFDPNSIAEITRSMENVLTGNILKKGLIENGYKTALRYNWQKTGSETLDIFRELLSGS